MQPPIPQRPIRAPNIDYANLHTRMRVVLHALYVCVCAAHSKQYAVDMRFTV